MSVYEFWGMKCPQCGSDKKLEVVCQVWATLQSDGSVETFGDNEFDDNSNCRCDNCDWEGKIKDTKI